MGRPLTPEYYDDLERRMRRVLAAVEDRFPPPQTALLAELIGANEPGVALEMLSEMLGEVGATIDPVTVEEIMRLADIMGLDHSVVNRLRPLTET